MSLKIYLDDCAYAKRLASLLLGAGHEVVTPADAGISGKADEVHFEYAVQHGLVILTRDPDDFAELAAGQPSHAGVLGIYQDNGV